MSKGKNESVKSVKRGVVVNRRHNRTVSQDVALSNPRWADIGGEDPVGVLADKHGNHIRRGKGNGWESMHRHAVAFASRVTKPATAKAA